MAREKPFEFLREREKLIMPANLKKMEKPNSDKHKKLSQSNKSLFQSLPKTSFVEFECNKISNIESVFVNPNTPDSKEDLIEKYGYAIKDESEGLRFSDIKKKFLAERYGGSGIVTHGGGVRCGYANKYQIKGIGANPLKGQGVDYWHSHGSFTLAEAFYEMLWGEILHQVLPYGAVRSVATILTGGQCWTKGTGKEEKKLTPRALMIREAALRIAHFERTYKFRPENKSLNIVHDTDRTRASINYLPNALPKPKNIPEDQWTSCSSTQKLKFGLLELCSRVAAQNALARARRFMHGASTASNTCLDGRWIDYGTTSLLSCYADCATGAGQRSFWDEHLNFYQIIDNLCFYIYKYFEIEKKEDLPAPTEIKQYYYSQFEKNLTQEFLGLTGFPETLLKHFYTHTESIELVKILIELARAGNQDIANTIPDDATKSGDFDLPNILFLASTAFDKNNLEEKLKNAIPNNQFRENFISSYWKFRFLLEKYSIENSIFSFKALNRLIKIRTAKRGKNLPILYRHKAFKKLEELIESYPCAEEICEMYGRTFSKTIDETEILYAKNLHEFELIWKKGNRDIYFNPLKNQWVTQNEIQKINTYPANDTTTTNSLKPEFLDAEMWWGDTYWQAIK